MTSDSLFVAEESSGWSTEGRRAEKPGLVGIAKLAAEGEQIRDGHNVEFLTLRSRSLLNRCASRHVPFSWTINPYRGCEFACKYCYARYTHQFMELDDLAFEQKIYVKQQAAWLLRQELKRVKPREQIAIGTATDPYQPAEKRYKVTQSILEVLAGHTGMHVGIVTKSNLVVRDVGLLRRIAAHNRLIVSLTITSAKADLARVLEPRAPRPDLRVQALSELANEGIHAGVIIAPILPGITDTPADLEAVVRAASEAGGRHVHANPLFLKSCSASIFLPFLEKEFPHLVADYRQRYKNRAFVSSAYHKHIESILRGLRRKYGFHDAPHRTPKDERNSTPKPRTAGVQLQFSF